MKRGKSNRVGHIDWGIKNSKYPIFRVLFLLGVQSLEVISKSVLKGVFLVEKREFRRKSKSLHGDRFRFNNTNSNFNLHLSI